MREKVSFAGAPACCASREANWRPREDLGGRNANAVNCKEGSGFRSHRSPGRWRARRIGLLAFVRVAAIGVLALAPGVVHATSLSEALPVPTITIYPGDAIKDSWLVDRAFPPSAPTRGDFVSSRETIVGKIARRTLLPGTPIPLNAVSAPKIVVNGAKVRIVFEEGVLSISTYGAALQDGCAGDVISLRNLETGLTVSGTVQADGSVRLSGG